MTDLLNQKIKTSFDKNQDRVLVAGMYAHNSTTDKFDYAEVSDNGDLHVNIHGTTGGGDLKARTDIADPATSTFLKCNTDGTLEMTAELSTAGLATSAIQTDGSQKAQVLGNTEGDGSGDSKHIHTDANGNVLTSVVSSVNVLPANAVNSGITNDPANSVAVGLRGRTNISDASTETFVLTDSDGHLQVDVLTSGTLTITGDAQIKAEDDTGSARNVRCNNSGHVKSACIGAESDGTLRQIQTNEVGQLKTKLVADDGATRREVRCNSSGQLEVKADVTNTTLAITASSLPLPTGGATSALQTTGNTSLASIDGKITACNTGAVTISSSALPTGGATSALQTAGNASLSTLAGAVSGTSVNVTTAKTTTSVSLYSGGSVTIAGGGTSFQDFINGTIGTGTFTQLNVDGLGDVQYLVEGTGTTPSVTLQELIGTSASLGFVSQTTGFSGSEDFAVIIADSKAQHRGLRITNTGGSAYTISSITAIYHA